MTKTYTLYFNDLTVEAQQEVLDFFGLTDSADGNFDVSPLAVLEREVDSEEEEKVRV